MPFFSVVIATRNRPALFARALKSVLVQSCSDTEIIVVNDGSTAEIDHEYDDLLKNLNSNRVRYFCLPAHGTGRGAGHARNFGAAKATAPYLGFLDDDDCWIAQDHLRQARAIITKSTTPVDLYMTNQVAYLGNQRQLGPIWIEDLPIILDHCGNRRDCDGAYLVAVDELLRSQGFCHLNTLIVRRRLYEDVGGLEETIRWEEDRDLYLRLIDRANVMKYFPVTVSRHNIPDPAKSASMTTTLSEMERRLFQIQVFRRAQYQSQHAAIRDYARKHHAYTLKRITEMLSISARHVDAAQYARRALRVRPTVKWAGYTAWLTLRGFFNSG